MTTSARSTHFGGFDSVYHLGTNATSPNHSSATHVIGNPSHNQNPGWGPKTARPWRDTSFTTEEHRNPNTLTSRGGNECWNSGHPVGDQRSSRSVSTFRPSRTNQRDESTSNRHEENSRDATTPVGSQPGNVSRVQAWNRPDSNRYASSLQSGRPTGASYPSNSPLLDRLAESTEPRFSYSARFGTGLGDHSPNIPNGDYLSSFQGDDRYQSLRTTPPPNQSTPKARTTPGPIHSSEFLPWQAAPGAQSSSRPTHILNGGPNHVSGLDPPNGAHLSADVELENALAGLTMSDFGNMSVSCLRGSHAKPNPHMTRSSPLEGSLTSERASSRSGQSPNDWYLERNSLPHMESLDHPVASSGHPSLHATAYPNTAMERDCRALQAPGNGFQGSPYLGRERLPRLGAELDDRSFCSSTLAAQDPKLARLREEDWHQWCGYNMMQRSQSNSAQGLPPHLFPYRVPHGMQNGTQLASVPHLPEVMVGNSNIPRALQELGPCHGLRSVLLDEFKTLTSNKSSKHFELKDIYGHVVEFSRDQQGSRFIQHKLDSAGKEERERVFSEIKREAVLLMKDVFGNYVIQKFFDFGNQTHKTFFLEHMRGKIFELSTHVYACRVIQKALEHNILLEQQASIVGELNGNIQACVLDSNGNHVIQKIVTCVPPEYYRLMVECFLTQVTHLSTHKFGCRIVQRLLDHCRPNDKARILDQIHKNARILITDQFGNYVPQHVIEYGSLEDRERIIAVVRQHLVPFSKQKFASNVVEKCFIYGTNQQRHEIMLQLMQRDHTGESSIPALLRDGFGNYVIQKLLDCLNDTDYIHLVLVLEPEINRLRRMIPNKQVENVLSKMRRFDVHTTSAGQSVQIENQSSLSTTPMLTPGESGAQSPLTASLPSTSNMAFQSFHYDQARRDSTQKIDC